MVTLQRVEIPGLKEAIQREARVRDTAFLDGNELVCGMEVRPICLETVIWLQQAGNGFMVPCTFFDDEERAAHAIQFLYFHLPTFRIPESPVIGFWRSFRDGWKEQMFVRKVTKATSRPLLYKEIGEWISDAFMDAPAGNGNSVRPPSYASYPVFIVDLFAEAGLPFTEKQIMQMRLKRLWQYLRIANLRVNGKKPTNPSDQIAVDFVAKN